MFLPTFLLLATAAIPTTAKTLLEAIENIPELSNFTSFYNANKFFASAFFGNKTLYPITVFIPNDKAFAKFYNTTGSPLTSVGPLELLTIIQYHTLVSGLDKNNLTTASSGSGLTVPTLLVSDQFNNRSAGSTLASKFGGPERANGQVVFISGSGSGVARRTVLSRQAGSSTSSVRSGLSSTVSITALDDKEGAWDGGHFHIIDGLLTPPTTCKATINGARLTALDNALTRASLWAALDSTKNITCLGPNNNAFTNAGSPDQNLTSANLSKALLFHTLPQVAYSDYLTDGQEFTSLQNMTVRVKVQGQGKDRQIWFNNAKVIDANVLTHNGLVHVLDAVMKPLEQINSTSSGTPGPTSAPTSAPTSTHTSAPTTTTTTGPATSTGAAVAIGMDTSRWGLFGFSGFLGVAGLALFGGLLL